MPASSSGCQLARPEGDKLTVPRSGQIVTLVADALAASGLAPARLELEITDGALITDAEMARATMLELKRLGVGLAIDDFGSGYSSLAYLSTFPFDKVKLDRGFIQGVFQNERARAVLRAILQLGQALELTVCVEGIETETQLGFLRADGCDQVQGFLLGRPSRDLAAAIAKPLTLRFE